MNAPEMPIWITAMQWASRSILVLLVILSIWSIATMIQCRRALLTSRGGPRGNELFAQLLQWVREGKISELKGNAEPSLYRDVLVEAMDQQRQEPARIDRSVKSLLTLRRTAIERDLTVLATLGANAPFIGLFGTVLGIIQAFGALGASQSNGASVMVGISEALVATAIGLFVAIPAVVAFNFFSRQLRVILRNCEALRDLYVARLKSE
jgi:biopolymer transport protein ExbB/TolQ